MATHPARLSSALRAFALLLVAAAGWAAPQQGLAATERSNAVPAFQADAQQLHSPARRALDWPRGDHCALPRKLSTSRAEARKRSGTAERKLVAPAGACAVLAAADLGERPSGAGWRLSPEDQGIEATRPAAFMSRGPPPLMAR